MKRIFTIALLAASTLFMTACAQSENKQSQAKYITKQEFLELVVNYEKIPTRGNSSGNGLASLTLQLRGVGPAGRWLPY